MQRNGPIDLGELPPVRNGLAEIELTTARIKAVRTVFGVGIFLVFIGLFKPLIQYLSWAFTPIFTTIGLVLVGVSIIYPCRVKLPVKTLEKLLAFMFGVTFIITLLVIAISFPQPTAFQYLVFRIVLALAAAGVATVIPGLLEVRWSKWVKASGALGVFVIIYFFSPAALVSIPK